MLAAVACLALPAVSGAAPRLEVAGNQLVDARGGQVFVPRGVNWPSFEYACSDGYGYSNTASPTKVGPDAAGAALIASWHVNTVRLPLNQDCWLGDDGLPAFGKASGYRAAVRRWVSVLHRADLAVVLDLHWSGPAGVVSNGQRAMPDERSDDFWRSVARTFKKDRSVIFDVFNEPYSRYGDGGLVFDLTWECWRNGGCAAPTAGDRQPLDGGTFNAIGMRALVDAIRSTGARQPIMLGGLDYASDLRDWLANRPADRGLVASFHNYGGHLCHAQACWDEVIAPIAREVPVVTGEFGETDCQTSSAESFMDWADRHGVGYLMWAWWVLPETDCSTLAVLADVEGTPRAPNGTALRAHLAALAPRVLLRAGTTQALDKAVEVSARCTTACWARATGRLVVAGRSFRLRPASHALPAGRKRTFALRVPGRARRAAASALNRRRAVSARITIVVGGSRKTRSVKLRRR